MSKYIVTQDGNFYSQDELYHYGVPGMKWGHRKKSNPALDRYKKAKKTYKQARKDYRKNVGFGFGIKGIAKASKAQDKLNKAEMDFVSEKARYKATKSDKSEFNTYMREMRKTGLVGSAADQASGGRSTRLYNKIKQEKGKQYADAVQKKLEKRVVGELVGTVAVAAGLTIVSAMLENS